MIVKKIFHAIGQGCFYSEQLWEHARKPFTLIYDCGSNNQEKLEKEINQSRYGVISALVISHFHEDHINGIKKLLKGRKIERVFIPSIFKWELAVYKELSSGGDSFQAASDPKKFFGTENVTEVNVAVDNNDTVLDLAEATQTMKHSNPIRIDNKGRTSSWILKFYVDQRSFRHLTPEQDAILNEFKTLDLSNTKKTTEVIAVYHKLVGKNRLNLTSMSMYSGPVIATCCTSGLSGSILNGDIELKNENAILPFQKHFANYANSIRTFHIPHHGSHKNMFRPITEFPVRKAIICSGYSNNHGHPSYQTIRMHEDQGIPVNVITEYDKNVVDCYPWHYYPDYRLKSDR